MNPKDNLLKTFTHTEPDWVPTPMVDRSMTVVTHGLVEYPRGGGIDDWGVKWKQGEEEVGAGLPITHPIQKPEDIENYPFPDPDSDDLMKPALEGLNEVDRSTTLVFGDNGWGLFERSWILTEMDRFLIWMYREPEAVDLLLIKIAKVKVRVTERLLDEVGVDGVRYGDDWGGESELMMGPDLWRTFIKPKQKLLYDACLQRDALLMQHADGHIEEIIPDLIEMRLTLLNPLQPECNNVKKVKKTYGSQISFHGAVGSRILDKGSTKQVKEEVKTRIDQLGKDGGYVLAPAHAYSYSEENLNAFREAAIEYGNIPEKWIRNSSVEMGDIEV